jgi:hypothetical protein
MSGRFVVLPLLFAIWFSATARAQTRSALVLTRDDARLAEASARLRGELVADGFVVAQGTAPPGLSPREAVEAMQASADAVLLITAEGIWLSDRLSGHPSFGLVQADAPAQLALRAVELLRARSSERVLPPPPAAPPPSVAPVIVATPPPVRERARYGVGLGAGLLQSSLGSTWLPVASLSTELPLGSRLALEFTLSGGALSQHEHASSEHGSVRIAQSFAAAGSALRLRSWAEPSVRIAAGAHVLQLEARGEPPYQGLRDVHASPFLSLGLGVRSPTCHHLCVALSADVLFTTRPGVVVLAMQEVARAERTSLLLRLEAIASF